MAALLFCHQVQLGTSVKAGNVTVQGNGTIHKSSTSIISLPAQDYIAMTSRLAPLFRRWFSV